MIERILVPLDGSEEPDGILPYVSQLARGLQAPIVLLSVVDSNVTGSGRAYFSELLGEVEQKARQLVDGVARRMTSAGLDAEALIRSGSPAEEIVHTAEDLGCGLIAMSTHGRNRLARGILGSVTYDVIHDSRVPVVTIAPERAQSYRGSDDALTKIMAPLDGTPNSESVLPYVEFLARKLGLQVLLVRVVQPLHLFWMDRLPAEIEEDAKAVEQGASDYLEGIATRLGNSGLNVRSEVLTGHPVDSVIELSLRTPHDIIAMAGGVPAGIAGRALGSAVDGLVRGTGGPVLVVPRGEEGQ